MDWDDLRAAVRTEMGAVFEVPVEALPDDACTDSVVQWDSLGHLMLMEAVESRFGIAFPHEEMVELLTETALVDALAARNGVQAAFSDQS